MVEGFSGREVHVAIERARWLFVARALERAGAVAHLAETVETRALRGRKQRTKTDRQDALCSESYWRRGGSQRRESRRSTSASGARDCICARR